MRALFDTNILLDIGLAAGGHSQKPLSPALLRPVKWGNPRD